MDVARRTWELDWHHRPTDDELDSAEQRYNCWIIRIIKIGDVYTTVMSPRR